jgi:hypothetical protein
MKNEFDVSEDVTVSIEESVVMDDDAIRSEKVKSFKRADKRRLNIDPYADKDQFDELY